MKSQRQAILIAAILAVATFIGIQLYVETRIATATKQDTSAAIRIKSGVKTADIAKGKDLEFEYVEKADISEEVKNLLDGVIKWDEEWESSPAKFKVRRAKRDLKPGSLLLQSDVERESSDPNDLNSILKTEGNVRAITVPVNPTALHGGLLEPDSRVDVLGVYSVYDPDGKTYRYSRTLLQNVKVIAINGIVAPEEYRKSARRTGGNHVTLALPPKVCEGLYLFASQAGTEVSLLVRNRDQKLVEKDLLESPRRIDNLFSDKELEAKDPFLEYCNQQSGN